MPRRIPVGIDDFRNLREEGLLYVDKTHLVRELLDDGAQVVLAPRPRRFGKTLNMTMLRCYFEKRREDLGHLFEDLSIWQAGPDYRAHFQRHPVLFLTFKGVRFGDFDSMWSVIRKRVGDLFDEHRALLDSGVLSELEVRRFRQILDDTADMAVYGDALLDLSAYLRRAHGEKVVILIDEYDAPIPSAVAGGFAGPILDFFRLFLTQGLKGNPHLFKAVLTGILRIAKESIFSGLNNLAVYSLLRPELSTCFGFTEPEVKALLDEVGRPDLLDDVRGYYNGYVFGGTPIYNPWSIVNLAASQDKILRAYWVSSSSNDLIHEALQRHALTTEEAIETLLAGGHVERPIDENVTLTQLDDDEDSLFSLLVFSGYLKAERVASSAPGAAPLFSLSIPNREVREVYTGTFQRWMRQRLGGGASRVRSLLRGLLSGDPEALAAHLQEFTTSLLSYDDAALRPEQVYHAFVIGLLATLEPDHLVRSNRESGHGRPDVTIRPRRPGQPGVILELKVARPGKKTLEKALSEGLAQIAANDYTAELRAAGASPVHAFAVAFDGKHVRVALADPGASSPIGASG